MGLGGPVIGLVILLVAAALLIGAAAGFVIALRLVPLMLARATDAQLDRLADKVREHADGAG